MTLCVGCAGWNLRRDSATGFPASGTHLERYASRLNAVEINSCFYRPHRISTYERWARSTPDGFCFATKLPKRITHERRLVGVEEELSKFLSEIAGLGKKRGPVLIQLPPSLQFSKATAQAFFKLFRSQTQGTLVCEPRHASWFTPAAEELLRKHEIGRVAADPGLNSSASLPGGCRSIAYFRWHGSPHMYYSQYDEAALTDLHRKIDSAAKGADEVWCIFDNTAEGAAILNAQAIQQMNEDSKSTPVTSRAT